MKVTRSMFQRFRQEDAIATKAVNSLRKAKERKRRQARMMQKVSSGSLPYAPVVMSWLSDQLGIPTNRITQEDIKKLKA